MTSTETGPSPPAVVPITGIPDPRPPWVDALLPRPAIEVRRGLSFDNDPPAEHSSVLALTAPSGRFVDVRFTLPSAPPSPFASPLFNGYATAGLSTAGVGAPGRDGCPGYECAAHVRWRHDIESSCGFGEDGADMLLLANGDVMEVGVMQMGGKARLFKEYWTKPSPDVETLPCVVAEGKGEGGRRGMVMRVGDYCQGIVQGEGEFWAERWEVLVRDGEEGRGWVRNEMSNTVGVEEAKVGLPCLWVIEEGRRLGDSFEIGGLAWEVNEVIA
ncbi:hypothetical protein NKR23_g9622 [Pleurostoma richardsiae]|uniref:Uncharacterized protein n=1 Tax=Pleurostoma richardsiae TaxID=41990 RepID=A0AA38R4C1_9PEZI|nr:hypothetical protein NKR23_g9622 [Pleurostoma richardsiae]